MAALCQEGADTASKNTADASKVTYGGRWRAFCEHFKQYKDESTLGINFAGIPEDDIYAFVVERSKWKSTDSNARRGGGIKGKTADSESFSNLKMGRHASYTYLPARGNLLQPRFRPSYLTFLCEYTHALVLALKRDEFRVE